MKKEFYILGALVLAFLYFTGRLTFKRLSMKEQYQKNLLTLRKHFPLWVLRSMEQMYRLETAHFTSGQFKGTYSPGMETFGKKFPYGWITVNREVWSKFPSAKPTGELWTGREGGTGKQKSFLKFPSLMAAMTTVAGFINHYQNPARWYSTNTESQARYKNSLSKMKPRWTDEVFE
jgi:hypothetical protein